MLSYHCWDEKVGGLLFKRESWNEKLGVGMKGMKGMN